MRRIEEDRATEFGINGSFLTGWGYGYGLLPVNGFSFGFLGDFDIAEKGNRKEKGTCVEIP